MSFSDTHPLPPPHLFNPRDTSFLLFFAIYNTHSIPEIISISFISPTHSTCIAPSLSPFLWETHQIRPQTSLWRWHRTVCNFPLSELNKFLIRWSALFSSLPLQICLLYLLTRRLLEYLRGGSLLPWQERSWLLTHRQFSFGKLCNKPGAYLPQLICVIIEQKQEGRWQKSRRDNCSSGHTHWQGNYDPG